MFSKNEKKLLCDLSWRLSLREVSMPGTKTYQHRCKSENHWIGGKYFIMFFFSLSMSLLQKVCYTMYCFSILLYFNTLLTINRLLQQTRNCFPILMFLVRFRSTYVGINLWIRSYWKIGTMTRNIQRLLIACLWGISAMLNDIQSIWVYSNNCITKIPFCST